jgi:CubicO group peptidase (beta-lactamase class C family)
MREARWDAVERFVEAAVADGTIAGAGLMAMSGGVVRHSLFRGTFSGARGRSNPVGPETIHPLYSFSKLVSATVLARLVDEGRLDWDTPVARWFPEFGQGGKQRTTLRHLLTHSAGVPTVEIGNVSTEDDWRAAWERLCAAPVEWEPGSRTAYHGLTGLFAAAQVGRRVCDGQPWDRVCRDRLFDPLGVRTLTFAVPADALPVAWVPQPKDPLPTSNQAALPFAGHPGAGCFGTVADALKVLRLHVDQGVLPGGRRWLSRESWSAMHTVQYGAQIARARSEGRSPAHETWGLGPLLRGDGPLEGGHGWFGFGTQSAADVFGHAGIDTVIGVGQPSTGKALFLACTSSPATSEKTVSLRGGVTDRVFVALGG